MKSDVPKHAQADVVNRVRRAVMGEIDRRSHALEAMIGRARARSSNAALHDLAGWLDGAGVDELLDDSAAPGKVRR